ncbi:hypothetical protein G0Q06_09595 [Puniceicoccales bacterium CK1056]|uniref:Uncharacterized protein n=1 Tax=Oceanipulchritudo coccoides TaxID=2706888 RepID=A0A6B2M315_9BACT|nr:glycosyltransferase family 39 protein [Oceanipulchritudo coccoides]NDV62702.1 hypothetical protein [Oceanipulchritudo coccoides]
MTSLPQRDVLRRFLLAYGIFASLLYVFLMLVAFPWWQASNHPVLLTVGANKNTEIRLGFSAHDEELLFIPAGKVTSFHWNWATELPPKKQYDLRLEFPKGTNGEVILKEVTVLNLHPNEGDVSLDLSELVDTPKDNVRIRKLGDGWGVLARPGGSFELPQGSLEQPSLAWFKDWVAATWGYLLFSGMGLLLFVTALRFPNAIEPRKRLVPVYETAALIIGVVAGTAIHLHLLKHAVPGYISGDATAYLMAALVGSPVSSQAPEALSYFASPLPLYPLLLRFGLQLLNGDINAFILVQGIVYSVSILLLALSLRRLVHGYLIGLVAFLILVSPFGVWASRHIEPTSFSASFWVLAIAAFIFLWQRSGLLRLTGWILFSLAATGAACTQSSGFILLALPTFLFIGALWWSYSNRGRNFWKIPVFWSTVGQVAIPFAIVLMTYFSINTVKSLDGTYSGMNGLTDIHQASAPFSSGFLDVRAIGDDDEYASFIKARNDAGYAFGGWSLRQHLLARLESPDGMSLAQRVEALQMRTSEFVESNEGRISFPAKLAVIGRIGGWAFAAPQKTAFSLEPITPSYEVPHAFADMEIAEAIQGELSLVASGTDLPIRLIKANSDPWVYLYNHSIVLVYPWLYRVLLIISLVGWTLAVSERKYLATAFISPFFLLIVYHMSQMHILGAELQTLDAVIWVSALGGITSVLKNTLQKETAEDDRRCLPPVKPKRLLTRHTRRPDDFIL